MQPMPTAKPLRGYQGQHDTSEQDDYLSDQHDLEVAHDGRIRASSVRAMSGGRARQSIEQRSDLLNLHMNGERGGIAATG